MTTIEDQEYGWSGKIQKQHEQEFYAHQAKSLTNQEYHQYAALFLKVMTDDDIFTHIKWSVPDTAKYFGVSAGTIYNWIVTGKLKASHELTQSKDAKHEYWRWWVYVRDVNALELEFKRIESTVVAAKYRVRAVWEARLVIAKARQSTRE